MACYWLEYNVTIPKLGYGDDVNLDLGWGNVWVGREEEVENGLASLHDTIWKLLCAAAEQQHVHLAWVIVSFHLCLDKTVITLLWLVKITVYNCSFFLDFLELRTAGKQYVWSFTPKGPKSGGCRATLLAGTYLINYWHWLAKQLTCLVLQVKINLSFKIEKSKGSRCISQQIGMDSMRQAQVTDCIWSPNKDNLF